MSQSITPTPVDTELASTAQGTSGSPVRVDPTGTTTQPVTAAQSTAANLNAQAVGNVAHGASDSGNPVKIGGVGRTANPTAVTGGQRADLFMDDLGKPVVRLHAPRDLIVKQTTTISASTTETDIVTGVASTFLDLVMLIVSNTSATAVRVDFREETGAGTGGTVLFSLYIPAGDCRGFAPPVPIPMGTAGNDWTAQSSASVTDLRIFAVAVKDV